MSNRLLALISLIAFLYVFFRAITSKDKTGFITTGEIIDACNDLSIDEEFRAAVVDKKITIARGKVMKEGDVFYDGMYFKMLPNERGEIKGIFKPSIWHRLFDGAKNFEREFRDGDRFTADLIIMDMAYTMTDELELVFTCKPISKITLTSE